MSQMEEVDSMTIPPLVLPTHVGQEAREECNRLCGKAEQAHAEYTKLAYRLASATIGNKGTKAILAALKGKKKALAEAYREYEEAVRVASAEAAPGADDEAPGSESDHREDAGGDPEVDLETPPSARTAKGGTVVLKDLVLVPDLPGQAKILLGKEEKKPYLELIGVAAETAREGRDLATALALMQTIEVAVKAGVPTADVALRLVHSRLAVVPVPSQADLEDVVLRWWQQHVQAVANKSDLARLVIETQRREGESLGALMVRMDPIARVALDLGVVSEDGLVASVLSRHTLGATYMSANAYFLSEAHKCKSWKKLDAFARERSAQESVQPAPTQPAAAAPATPIQAIQAEAPAAPAAPQATQHGGGRRRRGRSHRGGEQQEGEGRQGGGEQQEKALAKYPCTICKSREHKTHKCPHVEKAQKIFANNEAASKYPVAATRGLLAGQQVAIGLDSLAGQSLVREDAVPAGTVRRGGGPSLHGLSITGPTDLVMLQVKLGGEEWLEEFAVVTELPFETVLGWSTLGRLGCRLDPSARTATIRGKAIALAAAARAERPKSPKAIGYWLALARRMSKAPSSLQGRVQNVFERADDDQLARFLDGYEEWARGQLEAKGEYDPTVHPAPIEERLRWDQGLDAAATGVAAACPAVEASVHVTEILGKPVDGEKWFTEDGRAFAPPFMSEKEDNADVARNLKRIVDEAELLPQNKERLRLMLEKYRGIFGNYVRKVNPKHEPVVIERTGQPAHRPRRIIKDQRVAEAVMTWIEKAIERGIVQVSTKKYAGNLVPVIQNGKLRMAFDAQAENEVTVKDHFPVPPPMEILNLMREAELFSKHDEAESFFQYALAEGCESPFYGPDGRIYEFKVLTQGGTNSPASLHRMKQQQYAEFKPNEFQFMYDDSLIGVATPPGGDRNALETRLLDVEEKFFEVCKANGTILKPRKVHIATSKPVYQGFLVSHGSYQKDPEAIRPLVDMVPPKTAKELQSQLAMFGFYRHFIPGFGQLAAPLEEITHERWKPDTWQPRHAAALEEIRRRLAQQTMLVMPRYGETFYWRIDSGSTSGVSAVLGQRDKEGNFYPIRFFSRKATPQDRSRWSLEMEALGWYWTLVVKGGDYSRYSKNVIIGDPLPLHRLSDVLNHPKPNRLLERVALELQHLDLTFEYRPRKEMQDVDFLGRFQADNKSDVARLQAFLNEGRTVQIPPIPVAVAAALEERRYPGRLMQLVPATAAGALQLGEPVDVATAQREDPLWGAIINHKESGDGPAGLRSRAQQLGHRDRQHLLQLVAKSGGHDLNQFAIKDGLLFKVVKSGTLERHALAVPQELRLRVLAGAHDAPAAGHPGVEAMYETLKTSFYWPGMHADVAKWIQSCDTCNKVKQRSIVGHGSNKWGDLKPIKRRPFEKVVVDLIGPLETSAEGFKYVLTVVDPYTGETKLVPLRTKASEEIAEALLKEVVLKEGVPDRVQSDCAPELIGGAVAHLFKRAGIAQVHGTPFEAHVNGVSERHNGVVGMRLRLFLMDGHAWDWPDALPFVANSINTTVYAATGFTPYFLKTGHDPVKLGETWWRGAKADEPESVRTWAQRMARSRELASLSHKKKADAMKKRYDENHGEHDFQPGDRVALWVPQGHKLEAPTMGPFVISSFRGKGTKRTAWIHMEGHPNEPLLVHVDRLSHMPAAPPDAWRTRMEELERGTRLVTDPVLGAEAVQGEVHAAQASPEERDEENAEVEKPMQPEEVEIPDVIVDDNADDEAFDDREWDVEGIDGFEDRPDGSRWYLVRYKGFGDEKRRWYPDHELIRTMPKELEAYNSAVEAEELAKQLGRVREGTKSRRLQGLSPL